MAITFSKAFTIGIWNPHDVALDIIAGRCEELQYGLKEKREKSTKLFLLCSHISYLVFINLIYCNSHFFMRIAFSKPLCTTY